MNLYHKFISLSWATILIFSFNNKAFALSNEGKSEPKIDLILAGGGLSTCSSYSQKNCRDEIFSTDDLTEVLYRFDQKSRARFSQSEFFSKLPEQERVNINSLIDVIYNETKQRNVTKSAVRAALESSPVFELYRNLPDPSYYALFDFFEVAQRNKAGERKREKVSLWASKKQGSIEIFETFFQQAGIRAKSKGKNKPLLIAITASSRDPFESADFYTGVLSSFDAEVLWLPLDMSLQKAIETKSCDRLEAIRSDHLLFDRSRIYPARAQQQFELCQNPQKLLSQIRQADGIFFNGGDQSRTIAALVQSDNTTSDVLKAIQSAVADGEMIVAGTSAGTAVQAGGKTQNRSIPMISNGAPKNALHRGAFDSNAPSERCSNNTQCQTAQTQPGDLTYRQVGGTGLFDLGLLDTHFSERDREVRLAVFAHSTGVPFAFGVDETTALTVSKKSNGDLQLGVIGEQGVFIVDTQAGNYEAESAPKYVTGISHFVNAGDNVFYDHSVKQLVVSFDKTSKKLTSKERATAVAKLDGVWRHQVSKQCGTSNTIKWRQFDSNYLLKRASATQFAKNQKRQCSYTNLPFVVSQIVN